MKPTSSLLLASQRTRQLLVAIIASMAATVACAQWQPTKPMRIVLADAPGGVTDTMFRLIGPRLSDRLKQPVVIENKPGADGMLALEACSRSPGDGHTLCGVTVAHISVVPNLRAVPLDTLTDVVPVSPLVYSTGIIYVNPKIPASNIKELMALAKSKPGVLSYASFGTGTMPHIVFEWLKQENSVDLLHVPYISPPQALTAVVAGDVDVGFFAIGQAVPHIKTGKLKPIAVVGDVRSPLLPDLSTLKESGPDFFLKPWFGVVAPKGTSEAIRNLLARELAQIVNDASFAKDFAGPQGYEVFTATPANFEVFLRREREQVAKFIRARGIKAN